MSDESRAGKQPSGENDAPSARSRQAGEASPWAVAGLGMQFFVALALFAYAGSWLDKRFGTSPFGVMAGVFLGGGGTFYLGYRRLMSPGRGK